MTLDAVDVLDRDAAERADRLEGAGGAAAAGPDRVLRRPRRRLAQPRRPGDLAERRPSRAGQPAPLARLTDEIPLFTELLLASVDVRPAGGAGARPRLRWSRSAAGSTRGDARRTASPSSRATRAYPAVDDAEFARRTFVFAVLRQLTPEIGGVQTPALGRCPRGSRGLRGRDADRRAPRGWGVVYAELDRSRATAAHSSPGSARSSSRPRSVSRAAARCARRTRPRARGRVGARRSRAPARVRRAVREPGVGAARQVAPTLPAGEVSDGVGRSFDGRCPAARVSSPARRARDPRHAERVGRHLRARLRRRGLRGGRDVERRTRELARLRRRQRARRRAAPCDARAARARARRPALRRRRERLRGRARRARSVRAPARRDRRRRLQPRGREIRGRALRARRSVRTDRALRAKRRRICS